MVLFEGKDFDDMWVLKVEGGKVLRKRTIIRYMYHIYR